MESAVLKPRRLHGIITPPPSKSAVHRAVICAALAGGTGSVFPVEPSDDISATAGALRSLGAEIRVSGERLEIDGSGTFAADKAVINCRESGSTLRFLIPVAAAGGVNAVFSGDGRLPYRPLGPYLDLLPQAGVQCATKGGLPLEITGRLLPGSFSLPGNISSQFISGLLLALPLLGGDSRIELTSPLESSRYVDLTLAVMRDYGAATRKSRTGYEIPGRQRYRPRAYEVERDWSQAAFWLAAGAIGSPVSCRGLNPDSVQGDREIMPLLSRFGARLSAGNGLLSAEGGSLRGIEIDASQIPDLVPVLAVVASVSKGVTRIKNAARLRLKESDRLRTISQGLAALGADIRETADGLVICGAGRLRGGKCDGAGDHRIVMALAIASVRCENPVVINGCGCVSKSYPDFFERFNEAGGCADVIHLG